jgi:hypothetical protein
MVVLGAQQWRCLRTFPPGKIAGLTLNPPPSKPVLSKRLRSTDSGTYGSYTVVLGYSNKIIFLPSKAHKG